MKSNWTTEELKQALDSENLAKLETWHENKVREREATKAAKRAASKITVEQVKEHLGEQAALELVQRMADQAAAAASPLLSATSSHESAPASASKGSRGRK